MQRSPADEGRRWLEQALADLRAGRLLDDGGSYHMACFVAQQVAEKALKAYLYAQGEEVVIGRSVEALCRWATEYDPTFESLRQEVAPLDGYYVPTRYPNSLPDSIPARVYTATVAKEALRLADQVLAFVEERMTDEGGEFGGRRN